MFQNKTDLLNLFIVAPELFPNPLMGHFSTQHGHYIREMAAFMARHEEWRRISPKNDLPENEKGITLFACFNCHKFTRKRGYFPYRKRTIYDYCTPMRMSLSILKEDEYILPPDHLEKN